MSGLDDGAQQLIGIGITCQHHDLGTRNHDVAHLHVIHLQHTFNHG